MPSVRLKYWAHYNLYAANHSPGVTFFDNPNTTPLISNIPAGNTLLRTIVRGWVTIGCDWNPSTSFLPPEVLDATRLELAIWTDLNASAAVTPPALTDTLTDNQIVWRQQLVKGPSTFATGSGLSNILSATWTTSDGPTNESYARRGPGTGIDGQTYLLWRFQSDYGEYWHNGYSVGGTTFSGWLGANITLDQLFEAAP